MYYIGGVHTPMARKNTPAIFKRKSHTIIRVEAFRGKYVKKKLIREDINKTGIVHMTLKQTEAYLKDLFYNYVDGDKFSIKIQKQEGGHPTSSLTLHFFGITPQEAIELIEQDLGEDIKIDRSKPIPKQYLAAKQKIMDSGQKCLVSGRVDCTAEDLCRDAGVPRIAFYYNWKDWDAYCVEMYGRACKTLVARFKELSKNPPTEAQARKEFTVNAALYTIWYHLRTTRWGRENIQKINTFEVKEVFPAAANYLKKTFGITADDDQQAIWHRMLMDVAKTTDADKLAVRDHYVKQAKKMNK